MMLKAVIIFTDIRGFTRWVETEADSFRAVGDSFIHCFAQTLSNVFQGAFIKMLGDGAMIVKEIAATDDDKQICIQAIQRINDVRLHFPACLKIIKSLGTADLKLGWGVTRGFVYPLQVLGQTDYYGADINKAAFLCSKARPCGRIFDYDDFAFLADYLPGLTKKQIEYKGRGIKILRECN